MLNCFSFFWCFGSSSSVIDLILEMLQIVLVIRVEVVAVGYLVSLGLVISCWYISAESPFSSENSNSPTS